MTQISTGDGPTFTAPGKGVWELEATHFGRPATRLVQRTFPEGFERGFKEGTARYGLMLSHLKAGFVNDFTYNQPVPVGAPEGASGPPPKPVIMLLSRIHPEMRRRAKTSAQAFAEKRWRADLAHWDDVDKPAAIARHLEIQAVDVTALSDAELAAHIEACVAHVVDSVYLHHKYTIPACLLVGDFLAGAHEWTGAPTGELMGLLRGRSTISRGFAAEELDLAAKALAVSDEGRRILVGPGTAEEILAALGANPEVGPEVNAYLDAVRWRSVGYDVGDLTAGELPEVLLEALRATLGGSVAAPEGDLGLASIRDRVPAEHRDDFDDRLGEVRLMYRLRDERGVYGDGWATGLARRAMLEAGRRLVPGGHVHEAAQAVDLDLPEVTSLLLGGSGPGADEVARRTTWRTTKTIADAPQFLGGEPSPPPPADWFPASARRGARAIDTFLMSLFGVPDTPNSDTVLTGLAVNTGVYEGTARIVDSSEDFGRIKKGDVLVTRMTSPYFNVVLPQLGAIVTDRGGQLCHAAIVAREYGIPGIVGTRDATRLIADGSRVRVDGGTGEVRLLT